MKKLSKIKLHEATVLNESEMKTVLGGGDGTSDKERACAGKNLCDPCSWINSAYQIVYGRCSQNAFTDYRYCSDLNCHY